MKSTFLLIKTSLMLFLLLMVFLSACKKDKLDEDNNDKDPNDTTYAEVTFSIISYNVAGLPQGVSSSDPEKYMSSISPLINDYDIVQVQEDFCYHDSLLLFNNHTYVTDPMPCVPNGDGLNTFSNYPISNLDRNPWNDCTGADCLTPKGFSYSQIEIQGNVIDFYNVHCNAGSSTESLAARRANIAQLSKYISEHSAGKPVLLFGDFNSRYVREGDTIRALGELGFTDAWIKYIRNDSIPELGTPRLEACSPDRNNKDCEVVDKIFYRGISDIQISVLSYKTDDLRFYFEGDLSQPLSDHWPVSAKIKLKYRVD